MTIGTSLALEGAFGIYPDRPDPTPSIQTADAVWFNLRTLTRNIINCLPTEARDKLTPSLLHDALVEEVHLLHQLIPAHTQDRVRAHFYYCTHVDVPRVFTHAILKVPKTTLQHRLHELEQETYKPILKELSLPNFFLFNTELTGVHPSVLLLTHYAVDLLSRYKFKKLSLLESHTGLTKAPAMWYTKLNGCKDVTTIPFHRLTLQVFGDGALFAGALPVFRKRLMEISIEHKWTNVTTEEKIRFSLKRLKDIQERVFFTNFL